MVRSRRRYRAKCDIITRKEIRMDVRVMKQQREFVRLDMESLRKYGFIL